MESVAHDARPAFEQFAYVAVVELQRRSLLHRHILAGTAQGDWAQSLASVAMRVGYW